MPLLNRHGVHIYYEVHGQGRPLILSHGYSMNSTMWHAQVEKLKKEFKVIIWDMRGHGRSDHPDDPSKYSQAHTVGDIGAILDKTCGSETIAVVGGLSLGGYMSLAFYRAQPARVAALLIINSGPGFKKDSARDVWNRQAIKTAEEYERETEVNRNSKGLALAARGMLAQANSLIIDSLPNIKVPALLVFGEDDKQYRPAFDYMAKAIPHAKKAIIPGAGHAVNIDQPDRFLETIRPFLYEFGSPKATL